MSVISETIPNLVGIQMYYIPPEIIDPEATPIYQNWDSNIIIDEVNNRIQYDASTNPDNVLLYSWNMEYQEPVKNYFWIKNLSNETANVTMTNYTTAEYRVKDTETWTGFSMSTNNVQPGQTIQIRRAGTLMHPGIISCNKTFSVGGDVMSLLYGENFERTVMPTVSAGTPLLFRNLLQNNTTLIDASTLILPSQLQYQCFEDMFQGCTSLLYPPKLPATTLAEQCYRNMFSGCTSLTKAPELPATTMADNCYTSMFSKCTSLKTPPELPATVLANSCYLYMFSRCTSLAEAPELPATVLAYECYSSMFQYCTSLTTAPVLPATTLSNYCYYNMFLNCTSLTTAPEISAVTLVSKCYQYMFHGCTNLNYIKAMFTTTPSISYTNRWVYGVSATGTFVKNIAATWNSTGDNAVPNGWTVQYASS